MGPARVSNIGLEPSRKGLWAPDVIDARSERARTPVAGLDAGDRTLVLLFVSFMVGQKEGDPVYNAPLGTGRSITVATASSEIKLIVPAAVEETLLARSCRFFTICILSFPLLHRKLCLYPQAEV